MTEAEWLACVDPTPMLQFLRDRTSDEHYSNETEFAVSLAIFPLGHEEAQGPIILCETRLQPFGNLMPKISTLCNKIVKNLTRLGISTAEKLLPGCSTERIRELSAPLPFVIPRSVVELYKWSEGGRPQSGVGNEFFPGFGMDSLREMVGRPEGAWGRSVLILHVPKPAPLPSAEPKLYARTEVCVNGYSRCSQRYYGMIPRLKEVLTVLPPPKVPRGLTQPWKDVENELKLTLPDDYKAFIDVYGSGSICNFLAIWNFRDREYFKMPILDAISGPEGVIQWYNTVQTEGRHRWPYAMYPVSGGMLPFGAYADIHYVNWLTIGAPNKWTAVFWYSDGHEFIHLKGNTFLTFLLKLLKKKYKMNDLPKLDPPYEFRQFSK